MKEEKNSDEINSIFDTLEKQAKSFSLTIKRLKAEDPGTQLGLLLYQQASTSSALQRALSSLLEKITGQAVASTEAPDHKDFKTFILKNIEIEQARTRQTRLPYALVYGEIDIKNIKANQSRQHASFVCQHFDAICHDTFDVLDVFRSDPDLRFAILMPGVNKRTAVGKTESLLKKVQKNSLTTNGAELHLSLKMALSIYTHFDLLDAAHHLAVTTEEFDKFKRKKDGLRIVQCLHDDIDDCQVTVEERTELFNLLSTDL